MPRFFRLQFASVGTSATPFAHGLTSSRAGAAVAPDEYFFVQRTSGDVGPAYLVSSPSTTSIIFAVGTSAVLCDIFARWRHSTPR